MQQDELLDNNAVYRAVPPFPRIMGQNGQRLLEQGCAHAPTKDDWSEDGYDRSGSHRMDMNGQCLVEGTSMTGLLMIGWV